MAQYTQINPDALVTALTPINNSLGGKQDKTDNTLATTDKTISGAINEINTKVGNLTGALTWKGKFDILPAVTNYEAGNVVGVGNKEYVLTVTGSTKAWEELGDEGSYLLKSVAEETYLKKATGEVATANIADGAVIKEKLSTDVQSSLDKADNSLQKGNVAAPTSDTDAVNKSYVDGKTENLLTNDDSLNLNVPIIIYTSTDDDSIAANKANISFYLKFWEKYTSRITDTTFGDPNIRRPSNICFIPTILSVSKSNNIALGTGIIFGISGDPNISYYNGIFRATSMSDSTHDGSYKIVSIDANTGKLESASQLISSNISYSKFNTTAKDIFGAINEVNTLAKSKGNGTITEVKMNGVSKGTSGVVDLGTVLTEHQDISGKVDKTTLLNTLMVVDLSSHDIAVRKAALDDFKAKWLALGNTDLNGARFIGRFSDTNGNTSIHESGKNLMGEDTLLIYKQISPAFLTGFYGLSYIKDMANTMCGLYQIYVDYDNTNPGNIEITQIRDSETLDLLNRFVYAEVPTTYLKITDAESTYETKAHAAETLTETLRDYAKSEEIPIIGNMATANAITSIKNDLSPVLQEINLAGTDADRKAKLDKFETDWKALTGADTLDGARFVGYTGEPDNFIGIFIYNSSIEEGYSAIATSNGLSTYQVFISPTGAMISNSLFYHLQPITIRTDNTDYDMAANVAAIKKYINNLTFLGVYTYDGFTIPVSLTGNEFCGYLICNKYHEGDRLVLSGTVFFEGIAKIIVIDETGRYEEIVEIAGTNPLNTTSDNMIDAINEVNTLAKSKGNGTITGVRMNGASKGTSGVVDLGTVITSHQDISGKADKSAAIGSLSLSLDSTNYKITLSGTKVDGTTFTVSDVIDLPLESVVVNGSYNNTTKKVVLTLQSGSTVEFSVADLVSGLQSEITSTNKLSADLIADGTTNKVVTASEKTTWNGKQDALTNADVLTGITSTKVSNWDNAATNSHTHSNKSVLDGISSTDITNWNSKTDNVGTVTGVKMNGTTNNPTNGVVNLGTVITAHQDISGKQDKLISGTNIKTINGESVLGSGDITISSSASSSAYPEVNHGTGDTTFTLTPNTFHVWDEVTSLTLNFGSGISGMANEYLFQFTSGSTATSLTLPDGIKWANDNVPTIGANMIYQVSVLRGLASVLEFNNAIVFPIIGPTGNANEEYAKVYEYFVSTYNLTSASAHPSNGVIITETLICNDTNYGGPVLKVSLSGTRLLLWTQNAIDKSSVPAINNLGVYSTNYWD